MYRLKEIEIKDFRGFRQEKIEIPDADIVVLTGGNGFGKSSFFDAIEWSLTGTLRRYAESNQEKNSELFLTNKRGGGEEGYVKLVLHDGQAGLTLHRKTKVARGNDFNQGQLEGLSQEDLENLLVKDEYRDKYDFKRIFNFSHLLSQELIDEFVRGFKATERYSVLSSLIGIQDYTLYKDRFKVLEREVKEEVERVNKHIFALKKDEEKYRALASQEFDEIDKVDDRYLNLVREYNQITGEEMGPPEKHEDFYELLGIYWKIYEARLAELTSRREKLLELLAELPEYLELTRLKQVMKESRQKWQELLTNLHMLEKVDFIIENFPVYQRLQTADLPQGQFSAEIEALAWQVKVLERQPESLTESLALIAQEIPDERIKTYIHLWDKLTVEERELKLELEGIGRVIEKLGTLDHELIQRAQSYFSLAPNVKHCPICQTEIEVEKILALLKARLESEESVMLKEYLQAREEQLRLYSGTTQALENMHIEVRRFLNELLQERRSELEKKIFEKNRYEEDAGIAARVKNHAIDLGIEKEQAELLTEARLFKQELVERIIASGQNLSREQITQRLKELEASLTENMEKLIRFEMATNGLNLAEVTEESLRTTIASIDEELTSGQKNLATLTRIKTETGAIITYLRNSENQKKLEQVIKSLGKEQKRFTELSGLQRDLRILESQVPSVINEMTMGVLDNYKRTVNDFYRLLNPQPFYTKLDWEINQSYNSSTLILQSLSEDEQHRINPSFTYSSAQVNLVALSFFLSFAVQQQWSKLGCIFMDDPVQNMDDINIFAFVDVIRGLCLNSTIRKQVFISTHDSKFVNFMLKKFRMLRVFVLEYKGYGEDGPVIDRKIYEPRIYLEK